MTKTTTAGMDTHLLSEVTTLAMATIIERTDKVKFFLTTTSEDIEIDVGDGRGEQTFSAGEGVSRTNIENDAELNVDNLDILGVFDNVLLKETELRRGLFDFAEFRIFVFNHQDKSDGIVKIFRGQLGEVITTKLGFFRVTVRSLVQVYGKKTDEQYSKDCRADLGDERCLVPIFPIFVPRDTALVVGDFFRVSNDLVNLAFVAPFEDASGPTVDDQSGNGHIGTLGSLASLTKVSPLTGNVSLLLPLTASQDPSTAFVSYPDSASFSLDMQEFTVEARIMFTSLAQTIQVIASKYLNTGNQREWQFKRNAGNLEFVFSDDGIDPAFATISGAFSWVVDTEYHVAVTRDASDDIRLFVNGTQVGVTANNSTTIFAGSAAFHIGKIRSSGASDNSFVGRIDEVRIHLNTALYTAGFSPVEPFPTANDLIWEDFGNRVFEVTVAGVSDGAPPTYDQTIDNTTVDGGATLTTRHSWMRFAQVSAVSGGDDRRIFTVTELTPTSGETVGNKVPATLGFPNDWLNGGAVLFETGDNAGRAIEVRDFIEGASTQDIELISDMPSVIQVGDKLRVFPGCDKTNPICISKFNNGINFVGEPFVPGEDILGQYPDAR